MAGILDTVYSIVVVALAVLGLAFVFTRGSFATGDGADWSRWGELVAVAVFLVAMTATILLAT